MNGGVALVVEVDPAAHRAPARDALPRRSAPTASTTRSRACRAVPARSGSARSIGLEGERRRRPAGARRARRRRPTCSPIRRRARRAERLRAERPDARRGGSRCARDGPGRYIARSMAAMAAHVRGDARAAGARRGDVRLRQQHPRAGARRPASRTRSTSRASCRNTSGRCSARARDRSAGPRCRAIPPTSARPTTLALEMFARQRGALPLDSPGARARRVPGTAGAHLLARLRRARALRPGDQRSGAPRRRSRRRSSSAAIISTPARSRRRTAKPRACATAATRSPTGRC